MSIYRALSERFARIATIGEASAILGWDEAAMMPDGGAASRGDQLAALAGVSHDMLTDPKLGDDLAAAEPLDDDWHNANLALMRDRHKRAVCLPGDLVEAIAKASSSCERIWRSARQDSDFKAVAPALGELLALTRQAAVALSEALNLSPYDALMSQYQRGIASKDVEPIFANYEAFLREALPQAEAIQAARNAPAAAPPQVPVALQEALCRTLAQQAGLDFTAARLDRSMHPFCGGIPSDIRITTRYDESDYASALMGVLHETGHALYEAGLPKNFARQPVGEASGMATHESQSLIIEMQAVRSDAFLDYLSPLLHRSFGGDAETFSPAALRARLRHVERSFIRVEADEMTYPAHVILRFRLEQAMISGDLQVADLPGAWNEAMQSLLGITPPDDRRGCLQDIHWYAGLVGYFPSYTLGAMAAAQLMAAARQAVPGIDHGLAHGDFGPLRGWLRANVHGYGSRYGFNELLVKATGKALDPADFQRHLASRYLAVS